MLRSFQPGRAVSRRDFSQLAAAAPYVPRADSWDSGFAGDQIALDAALEWAMPRGTTSLVVLHKGRIAAERHAEGVNPAELEAVYSVTKSVTRRWSAPRLTMGRCLRSTSRWLNSSPLGGAMLAATSGCGMS